MTIEVTEKGLSAKEIFVRVNRIAEEIGLNDINERIRFESASSPSLGVYKVNGSKSIEELNRKFVTVCSKERDVLRQASVWASSRDWISKNQLK